MFDLYNRFAFYRTLAVDIKPIDEILQLIHDFLPVITKLHHMYIYCSSFWLKMCLHGLMPIALCSNPAAKNKRADSIHVLPWMLWTLSQTHKSDCIFIKVKPRLQNF